MLLHNTLGYQYCVLTQYADVTSNLILSGTRSVAYCPDFNELQGIIILLTLVTQCLDNGY